MHSGRMRTVRCSGHLGWGMCMPGGEGVMSVQGVSAWGVSARGGSVSEQAMGQRPPFWTEFLTHACENITFPQLLLRTIITGCMPKRKGKGSIIAVGGFSTWYTGMSGMWGCLN